MSLEKSIESLQKTMMDLIEVVKSIDTSNEVKRTTFTADEAADYVGVGRAVIIEAAKDGEVKHFRNGTRYLFRKKALDEWITVKEEESITYKDERSYMDYLQNELRKEAK
ncbi:MAG: helix-turn-helix domain-containing protein [Clostridiaceae bacterium]|nr:helix-turn-helix domain-containing protein [Clostridiaceae bacterium]MBW4860362.1 helix-turn-helix domain-containing protein [Clostridiaceae bacterium]MBW4867191.1 helix-turn-helix domain-containing protein [Clostridiaceae bacterium]